MIKIFVLMICLMTISTSWADGKAKVVLLKGKATFGGQPLRSNSALQGNGEIIVADKSYLKILLIESNTQIVLGANTTSKINFSAPADKQELNLIQGIARWITETIKGQGIKTVNAIMGVRGTDFFASYNPAMGETEMICFDGQVEIINSLEPMNTNLVSKNQWGGIGGRFGKKLSDVLTLSPELISGFDSALPK
jgi:ribosomal protein L27